MNQKYVECRDSPGGPVMRTLHFHCGVQVHLCPGTKIPAAAKKKQQRRTPLLKSARSQFLIPVCKTFYDLSLSLCHTHAHTHIPLQSHSRPTPPPSIVWSGSSHSSCVLAWWARPSLSLICLGKPDPSLRFQVTYTCSVEPSRQK